MDAELLEALSQTTGPACLVLLFCLWLLLRRTIRVRFWWMLLAWVLAWVVVPLTAYFGGILIMFAGIPIGWLYREIVEVESVGAVPYWLVVPTAALTAVCWVAIVGRIGRDMRSRPVFTLTCLVALLTAAGPVVRVGTFALDVQGAAVQTDCMSNLKSVGGGLQLYREDHEGAFPERLQDLVEDYTKIDLVLRCPADNEYYFYVAPCSSDPPPDRPVVIDANHRYRGSPKLMVVFANVEVGIFGVEEPVRPRQAEDE